MPEPIGVAVIGLDHWYSAFMVLDQIVAEPGVRLAGIAEENSSRLEEARQKWSPETEASDFRQILDDESVDLVFSFVSTGKNVEVCMESLGRGKHTLCVKPAAKTLGDANAISSAAEDAGVIWTSFEVYHRLTERSRYLKKLLSDGVIGQPISFFHVAHGGLPQPWPEQQGDSWWLDAEQVPGGAWIDHAIYAVDQARWYFEQEVESVSANMANRKHKDLALEDYGLAWMRLTNGLTTILEDTWTAEIGTRFDRFIGTEGSLQPDGDGFIVTKRGETQRYDPPAETRSLVSHLAAAVRGEQRLPFTNTCSIHNLSACLAAYESFRTGKHTTPQTSLSGQML